MSSDESFFSRWSRRKAAVREGAELAPEPPAAEPPAPIVPAPAPVAAPVSGIAAGAPPAEDKPPPPTLAEAEALTPASDFSRFVAPDVEAGVKNAALKKLFADPHFNTMDGLDTYIDDYGKPDPLPASMLRKLAQSQFLGLFDDEDKPPAAPAAAVTPAATPDEDLDLRLQPHDAAGCAEPEPRAEPGPGCDG